MRYHLTRLLTASTALLAVSAVAATAAHAEPEWQLNGKPVTETTPVTFTLHFFEAWDKGEPVITCGAVAGKGTVGPKGAGSITEFKLSKCYRKSGGICKTETREEQERTEWMRMIHLSWPTKLAGSEKDWVESHEGEGKGPDMGFEWECTNILGTTTKDKCEAGSIYPDPYGTYITSVHNREETVYQEFKGLLGPTPPLTCTIGGSGAGEFYATIVLKGPTGKTLSVKE